MCFENHIKPFFSVLHPSPIRVGYPSVAENHRRLRTLVSLHTPVHYNFSHYEGLSLYCFIKYFTLIKKPLYTEKTKKPILSMAKGHYSKPFYQLSQVNDKTQHLFYFNLACSQIMTKRNKIAGVSMKNFKT